MTLHDTCGLSGAHAQFSRDKEECCFRYVDGWVCGMAKESNAASSVKSVFDAAAKGARGVDKAVTFVAEGAASGAMGMLNDVAKAASVVGHTAAGATESAAAFTVSTAAGVKRFLVNMADEALQDELDKYRPKIAGALESLADAPERDFIELLGESPLHLTPKNVEKLKGVFPIPREQVIIWADAEFDLRPSGIAVTNKGVFIKSDVDAFTITDKGLRQDKSHLLYFQWKYFDPSWFADDGEKNPACLVSSLCRPRYIETCKSATTACGGELNVKQMLIDADDDELRGVQAEVTASANVFAAERAVFVEQRATASGHGELAEEANNMVDKLHGRNTRILGRDNAKNGPDRLVDGIYIQTKYYKSARGSLESGFDSTTHQYRYIKDGKPMQLEVPKDQYEQVLRGFENKIRQGKVPGVTDPKEAKNIVREGRITYQQARNLTKAGTIDSLKYDAATGAVVCTCAFGISFVATAFMNYRKTKDPEASIRAGVAAGVQVFGVSFMQHLVISQLARTGAADVLAAPSKVLVEKLGTRMSQTVVNGLRALGGKAPIGGAAASKQLAKMLRSNAVAATATFALLSIPDTIKLASGKSSGAQYARNMSSLVGSIAGAGLGTLAAGTAAAKGAAIAGTTVAPGIGTAVGLVGGFAGGTLGAMAVNAVGSVFYEGDGELFARYFNALLSVMAVEYMLDSDEIDSLVKALDDVSPERFSKLLEDAFAAEEQEAVVRSFLDEHFEAIVSKRERFVTPADEEVSKVLVELEESC